MKSKFSTIIKIVTTIFTLLFALLLTANAILMENTAAVSNFLGAKTQVILDNKDEDAEEEDTLYYKSQFNSLKEVIKNSEDLGEKAVAEGAVLLKNNSALPIDKGSKVSLFSASSIDLAVGGGGSSATSASSLNLKETFEDSSVNLDVNDNLWNWYTQNKATYGRSQGTSIGVAYSVNDASWDNLPSSKTERADVAIFVLARLGSENVDIRINQQGLTDDAKGDATDLINGNYLELTTKEKTVLAGLKAEKDKGTFGKIVVILNTANQVEGTFLEDEDYGIDAGLWCGSLGSTGARAIADIMVGNVNPSGRLADTFWVEHRLNPVLANFGVYNYSGLTSLGTTPAQTIFYSGYKGLPYVVYQEGIYNGYRYTETRYEDSVLNRAEVGDFNYTNTVSYPFGYGLSYSTFEYSNFQAVYDNDKDVYNVSVDVTNTGSFAGKETVQIYLQKPYTEYDVQNNIEKASVELVGFAKTKILAPDAKQTVTIEIDKEYFASYDAYGAKTYVVDSGDYYLTAGYDSHDAVNNILAYKADNGVTVNINKITSFNSNNGNKNLVYCENFDFGSDKVDKVTYSTTDDAVKAGLKTESTIITNQFDDVDMNLYSGRGSNTVQYMTRNNWNGTVQLGLDENNQFLYNNVKLAWNENLEYDTLELECVNVPQDNTAYPTYGSTATALSLMDLRIDDKGDEDPTNDEARPYDDPLWQDLLDQMSWQDYVDLLSCGERMTVAIASISKPSTIDHNGAVGVNQRYGANAGSNRGYAVTTNDPDKNSVPPAYPCNAIVAGTFNQELMTEYGNAWGEDALWAGYAGLYGPGINLHRGAYAGRTFEYYSEDPVLSGEICAPITAGIQAKGVYVYLKHCFLNEQESQRSQISTWATEQSVRELYLRAYEIAIEDGGAKNVMLGLNKIGATFTGNQGFCNNVLRDEFGMTGFVVTDFMGDPNRVRMPLGHTCGMDLPDRNFSSHKDIYEGYKTNHGKIAWAMRESAHRILYTVVHSATMNGISSSAKIITITPDWILWLNFGTQTATAFCIASWVVLASIYAFPFVSDKCKYLFAKVAGGKDKDKKIEKVKQNIILDKKQAEIKASKEGGNAYNERSEGISAWITRGVVVAVLIVALAINGVGVAKTFGKNAELLALEANQNANGILNETLGGEGIKDNIFEAEDAEFSGITAGGESGHACASRCVVIGENFSGGACLRNIRQSVTGVPNTLTFKFTSDKTAKVIMEASINCPKNWIGVQTSFDTMYRVAINGKETPTYKMTPSFGDCVNKFNGDDGFYMGVTEIPITIKEGENEIVLTSTPENSRNIDYINIKTSATLSGFVPANSWDLSCANILEYPTLSSQGKIALGDAHAYSLFEVPNLTVGVEKGLYSLVDNEESVSYHLYDSDVVLQQVFKTPQKLTVDSKYAWFAPEDGGNIIYTQKTIIATSKLPQIMVKVPIGYKFVGWCDKNNPSTFWTSESFAMPDYDLTLEPCFEVDEYVNETVTAELGKIELNPEVSTINTPIRQDKIVVGEFGKANNADTSKISVSNGSMLTDGVYEQTTVFGYLGKVQSGWSFLTMNPVNLTNGQKTLVVYLQNQGTETISFDFWQTNSSGAPTTSTNPHESVTLKAGESTRLCLYINYVNGNAMSYIQFTSDINSGMKLAMNQYIATGKLTQYEVQKYTATLLDGYAFTTGDTEVRLKEGSALPQINLTGENEGKVVYGYIINDGVNKTIVEAENFVMPNKEITVSPILIDEGTVLSGYIVNNGLTTKYVAKESFTMSSSVVSLTPVSFADGTKVSSGQVDWSVGSIQLQWAPSAEKVVKEDYVIDNNRVGTQYNVTGETGDGFRIMTACKLNSDRQRTMTYTMKNNGLSSIKFTAYQVASANTLTGVPSKAITLNAGEEITFDFSFTYSNNNAMCYFVLNSDMTNAKIWVAGSIN